MAKASVVLGRVIVAMSCAWASAACDDMDRAIEQKASEVLGNETAEPPPTQTAPVPTAPEQPAEPTPPERAEQDPKPAQPVEPAQPAEPKKVSPKPKASDVVKPPTTKPAEPKPTEPVKPVATPTPMEPPKPVEPPPPAEPAQPAKPATKVTVPQSAHVKITVPTRMQELLNADPRMQPWLNSTVAVIEGCYAQVRKENSSASGTITFVLEMHENERPDADITSLPPQLSGIVTCGTGKLMRAKRMPLFTGKEGEKHTVKVQFTP